MNKDEQIVTMKDTKRKIISRIITHLIKYWKKPRLLWFFSSFIIYFILINLSFSNIFRTIPNWIYIILGSIIKIIVLYYLSKSYLDNDVKKLGICRQLLLWFAFIPIVTVEQSLTKELISSIDKLDWNFLFLIVKITLCLILQCSLIVYYRYIKKINPFAHFTTDLSTIVIISLILGGWISITKNQDIDNITTLAILIIGFLIYNTIINNLLTKNNEKEIENNKTIKYKHKVPLLFIPYLELNSTTQKKEIIYRSHIIGSSISYLILLLNFPIFIDINNNLNSSLLSNLIISISLYYYLLVIRIIIFNLFVLYKEDSKTLFFVAFIIIITISSVSYLILKDVNKSNNKNLDFAGISMLLWVLPKIVPTLLDNFFSQKRYFQKKKIETTIRYRTLSAFANIFIYIYLLTLLVMIRQNKNLNSITCVSQNSFQSFAFGLLFSVILILIFSSIVYNYKSLYYETPIQSEQNNPTVVTDNDFDEYNIWFDLLTNFVSMIISCLILTSLYTISNSTPDKTFEIIKLSLPIFVPTFLDKIPIFINYYLFSRKVEITLTEKATFMKSIIDINLFLIVVTLYFLNYITDSPLELKYVWIIIIVIHIISSVIRICFYHKK